MIFMFGEREFAEIVALYFLTWEMDKVAWVLRCYNVFIFIFYFLNIVLTWKIVVPAEASVIYIYIYITIFWEFLYFGIFLFRPLIFRSVIRNNYLEGPGCSRDILKYNSTNFHVIQTTKIENYNDNFSVLCMDTLCV